MFRQPPADRPESGGRCVRACSTGQLPATTLHGRRRSWVRSVAGRTAREHRRLAYERHLQTMNWTPDNDQEDDNTSAAAVNAMTLLLLLLLLGAVDDAKCIVVTLVCVCLCLSVRVSLCLCVRVKRKSLRILACRVQFSISHGHRTPSYGRVLG